MLLLLGLSLGLVIGLGLGLGESIVLYRGFFLHILYSLENYLMCYMASVSVSLQQTSELIGQCIQIIHFSLNNYEKVHNQVNK